MQFKYVFCFFLFPLSLICQDNQAITEDIEVNFTFSRACEGEIYVSCFQYEENFMDSDKAVFSKILPCQDSHAVIGIDPALPRAMLGFIDMNGNGEIDLNFFGIPTEPYAISNDFSGKWREPKFEDAAESSDSKIITLDFMFWKER